MVAYAEMLDNHFFDSADLTYHVRPDIWLIRLGNPGTVIFSVYGFSSELDIDKQQQ